MTKKTFKDLMSKLSISPKAKLPSEAQPPVTTASPPPPKPRRDLPDITSTSLDLRRSASASASASDSRSSVSVEAMPRFDDDGFPIAPPRLDILKANLKSIQKEMKSIANKQQRKISLEERDVVFSLVPQSSDAIRIKANHRKSSSTAPPETRAPSIDSSTHESASSHTSSARLVKRSKHVNVKAEQEYLALLAHLGMIPKPLPNRSAVLRSPSSILDGTTTPPISVARASPVAPMLPILDPVESISEISSPSAIIPPIPPKRWKGDDQSTSPSIHSPKASPIRFSKQMMEETQKSVLSMQLGDGYPDTSALVVDGQGRLLLPSERRRNVSTRKATPPLLI
ncbi:hypothetical protein HDU98_007532 [Podochytrium sp. JEL0797]|nr:hypothetical protein HDU98_007532 [Podochytrium sp. JEL0797]